MARPISEIYDQMVAEKETFTELQGLQPAIDTSQTLLQNLTSSSRVSIWRLLLWVQAAGIHFHETMFDAHKAEVQDILAQSIPGSLPWYRDVALDYQHGDPLLYIDRKFQYSAINLEKKIVTQAAAVEAGNVLTIKVAKGASTLEKLSSAEFTAFKAYMNQRKYAGTRMSFITDDPDDLRIEYTIYFDPLVLASDGSLLSDSAVFPVSDTITEFIKKLPFNSVINLTRLTDSIQNTTGVVDPVLTLAEAKYAAYDFESFNTPSDKFSYLANAGYMRISPSFPLSSSLTFVANV